MKKVVYSVTKINKFGNNKMTGLGYITESDLVIACISQKGNPYIRIFEDCVKDCHAVRNAKDEFKGTVYEVREIETDHNGSKDTREIEVEYSVWYKLVD